MSLINKIMHKTTRHAKHSISPASGMLFVADHVSCLFLFLLGRRMTEASNTLVSISALRSFVWGRLRESCRLGSFLLASYRKSRKKTVCLKFVATLGELLW